METTQESMPDKDAGDTAVPVARPLRPRDLVTAKGACWYCDKPLDSVRRFCGKDCADAYDEEAAYTR
ncbi:hypothetical protein [Massilia glaciei]|nr:hypothetical protein [Massilia glaciei]